MCPPISISTVNLGYNGHGYIGWKIPLIGFFFGEIRGAGPCRGASTHFMSGGGLSEGYGHDGPDVCLADGQTEAHLKDMGRRA